MRFLDCSLLALLAVVAAAPSTSRAAGCSDTSGFAGVMASVDQAVPCDSATKHGKYVKQAKKALDGSLSGPCKKLFIKRFIANSTCGRGGQICCNLNKKGKDASKFVKGGCKGCVATATSVGLGCNTDGSCVVPTTTTLPLTTTTILTTTTTFAEQSSTTSTTSTTTTSTTSTTCPDGICVKLNLDFTNGKPGAVCGSAQDASNAVIKTLHCGGLSIGGGGSTVQEGPTPDGSTNRFSASCTSLNSICTILPTTTAPGVMTSDPDCTTTGCNFGTPLEIPNTAIPILSTCVLDTWAAPAAGTIDLSTGMSSTTVPLFSDTYLTGKVDQPCPRCYSGGVHVVGSPSSPATGTCDRGPRAGMACVSTNSVGLTRDCPGGGADATHPCATPPNDTCIDGAHVGKIEVALSPLTTSTVSMSDSAGNFCPAQGMGTPGTSGCFGQPTCRTITENGIPAGPITVGQPATATLASVFCISSTPSGTVNFAADLPGPGATSLPGTFVATMQ
jgi:hypothetical protein